MTKHLEGLPLGGSGLPFLFDLKDVHIKARDVTLDAYLMLPEDPLGLVIFAHGSTSSRRSPRNFRVAEAFREASFGSLLLDLLTPAEAHEASNVFDITLLAERLKAAVKWARHELPGVPRCFFGASTGAAAALWAAADLGDEIKIIVSRGGRPDLAMPRLPEIKAPTLLIVGEADKDVLELNRLAATQIPRVSLTIVPQATHLFEEEGAMEKVAETAISHLRHFL